jgi:Mn-dependent DtxR family transcriptional regulator
MLTYHGEIKTTLGERQQRVYDEIAKHENITNMELAAILCASINTVTPRVKELRDKKMVVMDRERVCKVTGRTVQAWRVFKHREY